MKKKSFLFFALICAGTLNAQFVLTPTEGLQTAGNTYTITRQATESENYYATIEAVKKVLPNASINETEFQKVFTVTDIGTTKIHINKYSFTPFNATCTYTLRFEMDNNSILINFENISDYDIKSKMNHLLLRVKSGKLNFKHPVLYVFKENGQTKFQKAKQDIEDWANLLIKNLKNEIEHE